tara:strand:- start:185 stop:454 length:270 start_codon:yes stop_codon:yes gene_type:complete
MLFAIHFLLNDFHYLTQLLGSEADYLKLVTLYQRRGWILRENADPITTLGASIEEEALSAALQPGVHYPRTDIISPEGVQAILSLYEAA